LSGRSSVIVATPLGAQVYRNVFGASVVTVPLWKEKETENGGRASS